ncbi:SHOCT domain-containing protein [Anaerolineae bacterium CFX7]|nr:SHOCT domain-containing protein [Anaerolineae bacterium CFX7]
MMGFGMGMLGLGALVMIAFWVLVIGGAVWLVMTLVRGNQSSIPSNQPQALATTPTTLSNATPLDILKTRYAKGEITKEQFEEMRRDLGL